FGLLHAACRRSTISAHQLIDSSISCDGVARRRSALVHHSPTPSAAAAQAVIASESAISSNDGTHPVAIWCSSSVRPRPWSLLRTLATAKDGQYFACWFAICLLTCKHNGIENQRTQESSHGDHQQQAGHQHPLPRLRER